MCVIITSPNGNKPEDALLELAIADNPHGWGIVSPHVQKTNKLVAWRGFGLPQLYWRMNLLTGQPFMLHFRFATDGDVGLKNCHPFKVHAGLYLMHNGILQIPMRDKAHSDSWHFARYYVRPYLNKHGMDTLIADTEQFVGKYNKITYMKRGGEILIANQHLGTERDGLWYSNDYSFPETQRRYVTGTHRGDQKLDQKWWDTYNWPDDDMAAWDAYDKVQKLDSIVVEHPTECDICDEPVTTLYHDAESQQFLCAGCADALLAPEPEPLGYDNRTWQDKYGSKCRDRSCSIVQ